MTFDDYEAAIKAIFDELEGIAEQTRNQAWVKVADESNPRFRSLMARHARLTKLAADLNDRMLEQLGIKP
ncbi:MAG: hypothetical protein AMXMBFR78_23320 [Rubrivivax sp.]